MNHVALPGKQDLAQMETLTAETANSSPRETQLITRATTPNKHTLGSTRGGEKFKSINMQCKSSTNHIYHSNPYIVEGDVFELIKLFLYYVCILCVTRS